MTPTPFAPAWVQRDSDIVKGQFKIAKRPDSDTHNTSRQLQQRILTTKYRDL